MVALAVAQRTDVFIRTQTNRDRTYLMLVENKRVVDAVAIVADLLRNPTPTVSAARQSPPQ